MPVLSHTQRHGEMPFLKAVKRASTGDIVVVGPAPPNIEEGEYFPHLLGVLAIVNETVWLNGTKICKTDVAETHGGRYLPFYEGALIHRRAGKAHEFAWIWPKLSDTEDKHVKHVSAIHLAADELESIPLSSGKGVVLIEKSPEKRILLLKKSRFFGIPSEKVAAKDVAEWEGQHALCFTTPNSVVVGQADSSDGAETISFFWRGSRKPALKISGDPNPNIWAARDRLFFLDRAKDAIFAAGSEAPVYVGYSAVKEADGFFATNTALIRREGPTVWADGKVVTDSLVYEWSLPHAHGLIYGRNGEIRLLVIKRIK